MRTSSYCEITESRIGAGSTGAGAGAGAGFGVEAGAAVGGTGVETRAGDEACTALSADAEGGRVVPGLAGNEGCKGADGVAGWRVGAGEEATSVGGAGSLGGSFGAAATAAFARACAIRSACFCSCLRLISIRASSC